MTFVHPSELKISDFNYTLPEEKIARYPVPQRDASKLLIYPGDNHLMVDQYKNIEKYLPEDAVMVFNETRVIHARLFFIKPTGGKVEIFCLEPDPHVHDLASAMQATHEVQWKCMVGGAGKWKDGQKLSLHMPVGLATGSKILQLTAEKVNRQGAVFTVRFAWEIRSLLQEVPGGAPSEEFTFSEVLQHAGALPLPPYLKRQADARDEQRYQTIFAKTEGSVAAPTAALHYTEQILERIRKKGIRTLFLTLHVGAGTFKPVKSEKMGGHDMHAEWLEISIDQIQAIMEQKRSGRPVVAVGTTSARTLESLFWIGVRLLRRENPLQQTYAIDQWYPYDHSSTIPVVASLQAVMAYLKEKKMDSLVTNTQIIIAPGYEFKVVDALATNFHQPQSTLLLLVAALIGDDWRKVYEFALSHQFRFLSYGDGCLLFNKHRTF